MEFENYKNFYFCYINNSNIRESGLSRKEHSDLQCMINNSEFDGGNWNISIGKNVSMEILWRQKEERVDVLEVTISKRKFGQRWRYERSQASIQEREWESKSREWLAMLSNISSVYSLVFHFLNSSYIQQHQKLYFLMEWNF